MNELKDYIISFTLVGLMVSCMFIFIISLGSSYDKTSVDLLGESSGFVNLEQKVNQSINESKQWENLLKSDKLLANAAGLVLFSIYGIGNLIYDSTIGFAVLIIDLANNILHVPSMVTGVIMVIIIVLLIFATWKMLKQG